MNIYYYMSRIVEIKESDLVGLIKTIIFEETEDQNNYYDLSPEQYYKLLRSVNFMAQAIPKRVLNMVFLGLIMVHHMRKKLKDVKNKKKETMLIREELMMSGI